MRHIILYLLRPYIIKKMNRGYFGSDMQNHILKTLGLRQKGIPKFEGHLPPPPGKINKSTVILLAAMFLLNTGFRYFSDYSITQEVATNMFAKWGSKAYLKTKVYKHGDIIKSWHDDVELANDSLKILRYREAQLFVEKCKRLDK
jgi:hypothetical protein